MWTTNQERRIVEHRLKQKSVGEGQRLSEDDDGQASISADFWEDGGRWTNQSCSFIWRRRRRKVRDV